MSEFMIQIVFTTFSDYDASEAVLSVLLESLQFSLSDKKIFWQMNGIAAPTVDHVTNLNNQLPLIVEPLKKS